MIQRNTQRTTPDPPKDADEPQAKKAPTVRLLWWMAAVIGTGVSL